MKRQARDWKKIIVNHSCHKGLVSRIYKVVLKTQHLKAGNPIGKWAKDVKKHFTKEEIQMSIKYIKICSIPLAIGQCQLEPQ